MMHALELAEVSTVLVQHIPNMLHLRVAPDRLQQQRYWLESKYRHDYWMSKLGQHRREIQSIGITHRRQSWLKILPVLEDILISEPLSRCIAHMAGLMKAHEIDCDFWTLANSVLTSHIEARHRCLHLLVFGEGLSVEHSVRLNRIRREVETYTDQVLASLEPFESDQCICFDAFWTNHTREQLDKLWRSCSNIDSRRLHLEFVRRTLRQSIVDRLCSSTHVTSSNTKICSSALSLLPEILFDSLGLIKSSHQLNMLAMSPETKPTGPLFGVQLDTGHSHPARSTGSTTASEERRWK